jgi:Glycosyl hydrolase family 47
LCLKFQICVSHFGDVANQLRHRNMAFSAPQRLPDFNNHERRSYENWTHSSRAPRSNSIHTYKDKPFYGGVHPARRKRWYTSRWFLGSITIFGLFYLMHQLSPGTQRDFDDAVNRWNQEMHDWESRQERVKEVFMYSWKGYVDHAWGNDEYRPISGTGRNMIPAGWFFV